MPFKFVCDTEHFPSGIMKRFDIDEVSIVIYHLADGFYATQCRCAHLLSPLNKGKILDGSKVQCRSHHAVFDIKSGKVVKWANFPPGIQILNFVRKEKDLKTFPTKVEDNNLYVVSVAEKKIRKKPK